MDAASIRTLLSEGVRSLLESGLPNPRLDAEFLLCAAAGVPRSFVAAHPEAVVSSEEADQFRQWIARRTTGYPIQYLLGSQEFFGRILTVNPHVLIPRPETELLVETALSTGLPVDALFLDVGTGSGCIAVTLVAERTTWTGLATDIDSQALEVAQTNARNCGVFERLDFRVGPDFEPVGDCAGRFDFIVSNPPYIAEGDPRVAPDVLAFEPHQALFAGSSGMVVIEKLLRDSGRFLRPDGYLLLEIGCGQSREVQEKARTFGWRVVSVHQDLAGIERCLVFRRAAD